MSNYRNAITEFIALSCDTQSVLHLVLLSHKHLPTQLKMFDDDTQAVLYII